MTSNHHAPYDLGYTVLQWLGTKSRKPGRQLIIKTILSSDCRLQLDYMKSESLVIANQQCRGEYVPGSCTHRPSHHESL